MQDSNASSCSVSVVDISMACCQPVKIKYSLIVWGVKSSVIQFSILYNVFYTLQGEKGDMGLAGPIGPQGIPVSAEPEHTLTFQIL